MTEMQTESIPWFNRTFHFNQATAPLPSILARLRGTPARLDELFRGQPVAALVKKMDGKWSAQENAGHLLALEALWFARVDDYKRSATTLAIADLQNRQTEAENYNARDLRTVLQGFRSSRARPLESVSHLDPRSLDHSIPHPRLRLPMRLIDHLFFVAEHDDHHLARIWDLLNQTQL